MEFLAWVVFAVALAIIEIFTAGFFALFFAVGAGITAIAALFIPALNTQLGIFLLASILCVLVGRPILKKVLNLSDGPAKASNASALLGETVLVLKEVTRYGGRVRVLHSGETWSAYLKADQEAPLRVDQEGVVVAVDGAKLVIQRHATGESTSVVP